MNLKHHQTFESLMEGYTPSLFEVLEDREARVHKQNQLMQHNPQATVVVLKVNMPGPVKVNQITKELLLIGAQSILESLNEKNYDVKNSFTETTSVSTTFYCLIDTSNGKEIKDKMVFIEDNHQYGRLFDIDVMNRDGQISRDNMGYPTRKCFICNHDAKVCGRSRTHDLPTLHHAIKIMLGFQEDNNDANIENY